MPLKSADTLDLLTDVKSAAVDRWHPEMHLKMNGGILSLLYQQVKLFLLLSSFRIWWTQYSFFLISCFMKLENHKIIVICSTTLFHFFYSEFWQHVWRFFFFFFYQMTNWKKNCVCGGLSLVAYSSSLCYLCVSLLLWGNVEQQQQPLSWQATCWKCHVILTWLLTVRRPSCETTYTWGGMLFHDCDWF